jgi:NAD(P)-dependent dehydrogenase (short-subunit alcohol dehydrogenase family)
LPLITSAWPNALNFQGCRVAAVYHGNGRGQRVRGCFGQDKPTDIARPVAFLASDRADFVTGAKFSVLF